MGVLFFLFLVFILVLRVKNSLKIDNIFREEIIEIDERDEI